MPTSRTHRSITPRASAARHKNLPLRLLLALAASVSTGYAAPPSLDEIQRALDGPFRTAAAKPVVEHRGPLMRRLEPLLLQQARHLIGQLKPLPQVPAAATTVKRKLSSEHGVRPDAHTAAGLAILYRTFPDEAFPAELTRGQARDHALTILRANLWTHGAGGIPCDDGKPWQNQWQSALWAAMTGQAGWLLWDDLSPQERWLAARMICDEADRFVNAKPPAQVTIDTKAEENAWNSMVLSLAHCMFPQHPNNKAWGEAASRWMISAFARQQDVGRSDVVDGKPVREWIDAANIHDDFTLENHDRVHPDYMSTTTMLSYQLPFFTWAGKTPPAATAFNVEGIYASSKKMTFPDGGWIYPGGQDWHLHRNVDWVQYHAAASVLFNDRQAAALFRLALETFEKMAARQAPAGSVIRDGETNFASSQAMVLEWNAQAYLLMAQLGEGVDPVTEAELWTSLSGRHVFEHGKFALLRTPRSVATFSWGRQVMGMVLPLRDDLLLTPHPRGLIGDLEFGGDKRETLTVQKVEVAPAADSLGVAGILMRANGKLEQRFAFLALPDGRVIYADLVSLTGEARPTTLNLGTLGILNDTHWPHHDGSRTLAFEGGSRTFHAAEAKTEQPLIASSPWYNLDGLGICIINASGQQAYQPTPTAAVGRLEQLLHLNYMSRERMNAAAPASVLAHGIFVFHPEQTAEQTISAAAKCRLLTQPGSRLMRLKLDDDTEVAIDLDRLTIKIDEHQR